MNFINHFALLQYILNPTRFDNVIDLVFCNNPSTISNVRVSAPFSSSDHNSIDIYIYYKSSCENVSKRLLWHKCDWAGFTYFCNSYDWSTIFMSSLCPNEYW